MKRGENFLCGGLIIGIMVSRKLAEDSYAWIALELKSSRVS